MHAQYYAMQSHWFLGAYVFALHSGACVCSVRSYKVAFSMHDTVNIYMDICCVRSYLFISAHRHTRRVYIIFCLLFGKCALAERRQEKEEENTQCNR